MSKLRLKSEKRRGEGSDGTLAGVGRRGEESKGGGMIEGRRKV